MIGTRRKRPRFFHPVVTGSLIILLGIAIVYVSYTAQNGLPGQTTFRLSVDVPDAAEMTKNSDVRVGGARIGQVLTISAEPARRGRQPFARLGLALTKVSSLPVDTRAKIRLASLLGGKYLELRPGTSARKIRDGGTLPLRRAIPIVDLDQAFKTFGGPTRTGLQKVLNESGNALAGRGTAINDVFVSTRSLVGPLERVTANLADSRTQLAQFIRSASSATATLAPLADEINALIAHGDTTLQALAAAGPSLGAALDELPPTERVSTRTLRRVQPVLRDAAVLADALRPAAGDLPLAARRLDGIIRTSTPVLRRVPELSGPLGATFTAVDRFARDPSVRPAIRALGDDDLATFATSLLLSLGGVLHQSSAAQQACNVVGLWARNTASAFSDGDDTAAFLTFAPIFNAGQTLQAAKPAADLHFNPYPKEDAQTCEAGNERYDPGKVIGHPAATTGRSAPPTGRPATVGAR